MTIGSGISTPTSSENNIVLLKKSAQTRVNWDLESFTKQISRTISVLETTKTTKSKKKFLNPSKK
jgi:hypothetical protein